MDLSVNAMLFALAAHGTQKRKYTGNPYTDHLAEVAGIVATIDPNPTMIAVAWLHDTLEDTETTFDQLDEEFGTIIACAVLLLTNQEKGSRAERAALDRHRLSKAKGWIQTIKVADLISNTSSIVEHDPKFARVYLEEKRQLLDVLTKADPRLIDIARRTIEQAIS